MIGTTLDKYEVLQKVGEGGMATVYRGRHSTLNRDVAIKVLHPHLSSSTRNRMRFAREAKAVERLRHDNILEIFDYSGDEGSDCYIVTEFVEGETLTSLLHRCGRLPSEIVAILGIHITRALAFAHEEGILHRDLKPDNIMVRIDGTVKLMDFGIARFLDESQVTMTGALVGSPAFMSPEQAREADLDLRSDLFALGTVLFYLVSGHLPFSGSNPSLILKNVIEGNRPNVSELAPTMSASLADVIERLMATHPDDRFVSAPAVEQHLQVCLTEARIDLDAPEWHLRPFIEEPEAYEARLETHLSQILVTEGTRLLQEGDHLAALRMFNRLLSMDEDNEEVLALVQNLHGDPTQAIRRWPRLGLVAMVVLAVGGAGLWGLARLGDEISEDAVPSPDALSLGPAVAPLADPLPAPVGPTPPVVAPVAPIVAPRAAPAPAPRKPRTGIIRRPAPAPLPPPEPTPGGTADEVGTVVVRSTGDYVADVYLRGTRMGRTNKDIKLPVGSHDLEIRSDFLYGHTEEGVVVSAGERRVVQVELRVRPSSVVFPNTWDAGCQVFLTDAGHRDQNIGSIGRISRHYQLDRPDQRVEIRLECPDGSGRTETWPIITASEIRFPEGSGPSTP